MRSEFQRDVEGWLGAQAFVMAKGLLSRCRPEQVERIGERLGLFIMRSAKKRRETCLRNLRLGFPEMSDRDRHALAERVFRHYGLVSADFLVSHKRSREEFESQVSAINTHYLEDSLAKNKGIILVTGHFGNWERASTWLGYHGHPVTVVARDTRNLRMNQMVNDLRAIGGTEVISRGNAARPIIEKLRQNKLVGILPDQNDDEIFIPYFGQPAGTVLGPGVIAERTGAPVVACWCVRTGPLRYRLEFQPPLVADPSYTTKGEGIMRAMTESLESIVRQYPEQWLWIHDRWKSARKRGMLPPGY